MSRFAFKESVEIVGGGLVVNPAPFVELPKDDVHPFALLHQQTVVAMRVVFKRLRLDAGFLFALLWLGCSFITFIIRRRIDVLYDACTACLHIANLVLDLLIQNQVAVYRNASLANGFECLLQFFLLLEFRILLIYTFFLYY